ncbi:shikimate kinase [Suttonella ornithocola]|uniref:Shikimate kinase n=1 Tax=Suttonella ornithocola TaxID=279832 RepID=A0A380MUC6_9GAMM|nr:shikimate kinase [Suttonella ornithocola]SUO95784.1 Shikimate kinase 1 [Suttonella ornithocola]
MFRKIVLIGPMGAGKTSLGKRLAHRLHWQFFDTDHVIINKTGADIPLIFEREGETGFRKREHQALKEILETPIDAVVACGGGIVITPENRSLIMGQALVVFLDVSVERQLQRIGMDKNRPLVHAPDKRERLQKLRDERLGLYEGLADIRINTDTNNFTISFNRLLNNVREFIRTNVP